jgi:chromosome segregation ATPase
MADPPHSPLKDYILRLRDTLGEILDAQEFFSSESYERREEARTRLQSLRRKRAALQRKLDAARRQKSLAGETIQQLEPSLDSVTQAIEELERRLANG